MMKPVVNEIYRNGFPSGNDQMIIIEDNFFYIKLKTLEVQTYWLFVFCANNRRVNLLK